MRAQTELAIAEADVILFLIDARAGLTPTTASSPMSRAARGKPVILVANKSEGKAGETGYYEAFELGLGEPVPLSAEHGTGLADLRRRGRRRGWRERAFPPEDEEAEDDATRKNSSAADDEEEVVDTYDDTKPMRIAVVGRPNAGKSTLINRMIGEERLLTGPEAGITRDSISVDWEWRGRTHQAVRHRRHAPQGARPGEAGKALRRRRAACGQVRRGRDRGARRDASLREAGPADRRPHHSRGPCAGHRPQQMGPGRKPAGGAGRNAGKDRAAAAADQAASRW